MKHLLSLFLFISIGISLFGCTTRQDLVWEGNAMGSYKGEAWLQSLVDHLPVSWETNTSALTITYPYEDSLFPRDIAAPTITWEDRHADSTQWFMVIRLHDRQAPIYALVNQPLWRPDEALWEKIKVGSIGAPVTIDIMGINDIREPNISAVDSLRFSTSPDPVDAAIFFRQVPLPFSTKNFDQMKWCIGDISSNDEPRVVMEKLPICASCHGFSTDGKTLSMEMNYGGDSGAQFIAPVEKKMVLTDDHFISWNDYPKAGILPKSRGLFGKMSPSADYLISSVNEISLALITNELAFSQVFFPTYGILASYMVKDGTFHPLPGADDFEYVHANPNWSPDEKYVVFSRARTKNEVHDDISHVVPQFKDEGIHALNDKYNIQFDLYRLAFNQGKGGVPEAIEGASRNGFSNYFPRYSPDGKWIVFTRSKTGIMLQPDSLLFIVPSDGGVARKMSCNRSLFNSWHSWSPDGKWLLFSSKANSPFTEIFLTHIDAQGNDTPPVVLSQFSSTTHAANVPEFANMAPDAILRIVVTEYND